MARARLGGAWRCGWALAVVAALVPVAAIGTTAAPRTVAQEYDLKAAFLFNFAQFVEWPADAFAEPGTPITIGILGQDPFGSSLDDIVAGETVHNRPLAVRRYQSVDQIESCQILFISPSEAPRLGQIMKALAHRSVLTVGETKDFTHSGIVAFDVIQRRVRLRVNLAAATEARLTISSKLLRQAQIVKSSGGRN